YARTKPLLNGVPNDDGVVYIVSGALGEKRYNAANNPNFYFEILNDEFNSVYLSVETTDSTFTITTFETETGEIIDTYTKTKSEDDHEHDYYLIDGKLVCNEYPHSRPLTSYTGFAKTLDEEIMYFINGELYRGLLVIGSD